MDNKTFDKKFNQYKRFLLIVILLICILLIIFKTSIESWFTIILFALISAIIQFITSFFTEKGKNLATKEDVSDITSKIESIKDSYNKSLESHKIELQKEFERHKYIMNLCLSMDKEIIQRLMAFQKANSQYTIDSSNETELLQSIQNLYESLSAYKFRYFHIPIFQQLYQGVYKICDNEYNNEKNFQCSGTIKPSFTQNDIRLLYIISMDILKKMMPTLQFEI